MHIRRTLVAAACAAITAGTPCAEARDVARVFEGMMRTELQAALGPPDMVRTLRRREAFIYCPITLFGFNPTKGSFATVWMFEDRVVGARTYPSSFWTSCEDFIAAFTWNEEPHPVLPVETCLKC
jgi:hypothetical protein